MIKVFVFFFLIALVIINWNDISLIFNYRFINDKLQEVVAKNDLDEEKPEKNEPDRISIPKIEIEAPLWFVETKEKEEFDEALEKGVVHYPESALPGERGEVIILGHSAPPGWPEINYDNVFSRLNELTQKDGILIYFQNQLYLYQVKEKDYLGSGEEIPSSDLTNSDFSLILISCWPPGKNLKRIIIKAELINY